MWSSGLYSICDEDRREGGALQAAMSIPMPPSLPSKWPLSAQGPITDRNHDKYYQMQHVSKAVKSINIVKSWWNHTGYFEELNLHINEYGV